MVMSKSAGLAGIIAVISIVVNIFSAPMSGICVGLQTTEEWVPGNLIVIEIPSLEKKVLVEGPCMGPCFSPVDAEQIAFGMNGTIWTIKSDGSQSQPENTGIPVQFFYNSDNILVGMEGGALYWLRLDNEMGQGDYFYWVAPYAMAGMQRCKVGTTDVENLIGKQLIWGGVSRDGRHASGCGLDPWIYVFKLDLSTGDVTGDWRGCNSSVSPDGKYILHNLAANPEWGDECNGESWCSMVLDWETGEQVEILNFACNNDMQHWSHFDTAVIMSLNFDRWGKSCSADLHEPSGLLYNIVTEELINVGQCVPFDYFPGESGEFEDRVAEPSFSPPGGILADGRENVIISTATSGASIRYTMDGSAPSQSTGTEILSGASVSVSVLPGDPVTIRAIAFKDGLPESIVATATYSALDTGSWITITSPDEGEIYEVGDTCHIRWINSTDVNVSGMQIHASFDEGGLSFYPVNGDSLVDITSPYWQDYAWIIPKVLNNESTISTSVRIRAKPYGRQYPQGISGTFNIVEKNSILDPMIISTGGAHGLTVTHAGPNTIVFAMGKGLLTGVDVFDCAGRCKASITSSSSTGEKTLTWCGKESGNGGLAGGWYIAAGRGRNFQQSRIFVIR